MSPPVRAAGVLRRAFEFTQRERRFVIDQLARVRGLMPLLMKRRNRSNWTPEDLAEIRGHFIRLRALSPYVAMLLLPGGFFALPLMAWWLDRRRERRVSAAPDLPDRP